MPSDDGQCKSNAVSIGHDVESVEGVEALQDFEENILIKSIIHLLTQTYTHLPTLTLMVPTNGEGSYFTFRPNSQQLLHLHLVSKMKAVKASSAILNTLCITRIIYGFQLDSHNQRVHHLVAPKSLRGVGLTNLHAQTDPNDEEDKSNNTVDIDSLLETPIFDPDKSNSWFANLVKNDYNTAEALYGGLVIAMGVVLSQEALRFVKYGASGYVPFHGGGGGQLF